MSRVSVTGGYTTNGVAALQTSPKIGKGDPSKHASPATQGTQEPAFLGMPSRAHQRKLSPAPTPASQRHLACTGRRPSALWQVSHGCRREAGARPFVASAMRPRWGRTRTRQIGGGGRGRRARGRARAQGWASAARRNARTTHARGPRPRPRSGCPGRRRGRWEALVGALPC